MTSRSLVENMMSPKSWFEMYLASQHRAKHASYPEYKGFNPHFNYDWIACKKKVANVSADAAGDGTPAGSNSSEDLNSEESETAPTDASSLPCKLADASSHSEKPPLLQLDTGDDTLSRVDTGAGTLTRVDKDDDTFNSPDFLDVRKYLLICCPPFFSFVFFAPSVSFLPGVVSLRGVLFHALPCHS